jgi:hypothetical protein
MQPAPSTRQTPSAAHQRRTDTAPKAPRASGLTISLWLLAALIAEAELLLWLLERAYSV